ncbi:UBX domain-containing protein 11 isoform X2 [Dendrobates tinctorius]|uniref:UBX domain-containing protein 11 isoform X2 n=1 Tax=Dendrobates tinctorius TaxID=92724 RepID=UPI003CC92EA6
MSTQLTTLGRARRNKTLGVRSDPGDVQMAQGGPTPEISGSPRKTMPGAATAGRRAAPFKDNAAYLVASLPSGNSFSQKKTHYALGKEQGLSDFDLLSSTVRRVSELENRVKLQVREIQLKDQAISALEQKIKKLQTRGTDHPEGKNQVQDLEKKCQELQKKVDEMEQFLSDYGLIWVGDDSSSKASEQETLDSSAGPSSYTLQPDFDLVLENLRDLNLLGGEGVSHIEYKEGAARLRLPEPVPLTLCKNGIIMFQGPFRSYQEPSTQQCLRDIMDGYFPSELQTRFPDGVTFQGPKADEKTQESLIESPLVLLMNKGSQSNAVVCTLRIKSETGDHNYKVQMLPTETIGDLRALLSLHGAPDVSSCDIISGFPHHVYDNYSCTLQDAGLVPNALLLLRRKKPKSTENTRNFS